MSRHCLDTTMPDATPVSVCAGWDRPLGRLFLDVEGPVEDTRTDDEGILYSSLDDADAPRRDWSYFAERLAEHGIELPEAMSSAIAADVADDAGNEVFDWSASRASCPDAEPDRALMARDGAPR